MALIVQKYGGTSVGSPERIRNVARRVARFHANGDQVVVVVSAMSGETNRLIALASVIALQGNAPLIPVYSRRRKHWWQRRTVVIGEPMDCRALCGKPVPSMADVAALTGELQKRLAACKDVYDQREENR